VEIANRYSRSPVFWRMFNPEDSLFLFGVGQGVAQPGQVIGPLQHAAGRFKLELREGGIAGRFLLPAGQVFAVGSRWVLGEDGRLMPEGPPPPQPPPVTVTRRVPGFKVEQHGFAFRNNFPFTSFPVQEIAGIPLTSATYGLCGGMAYATRDYFEAGQPIPATQSPPVGGPLFDFLWRRLLDSFNLPFGAGSPSRYLQLMSPALADAGPPTFFGVRSRADEMITVSWPRVRATIDQGRLCPLALVLMKSDDPGKIFENHQVLVFGYEIAGPIVTLLINDPNHERREVRLTLDTTTVNRHTVNYSETLNDGAVLWCFFPTDYVFATPPEVPAASWDSGWRSVGRIIASPPELLSMNRDHVAIFGRGIEGALWCTETAGSVWSPWRSLGGTITSAPGGTCWSDGRMDLFARGADGVLAHLWFANGGWSAWESLGAPSTIAGGPDACSWGPGRLDVFARGTDDQIWHMYYDGGWSGWMPLGGRATSDPTAVSWGPGRIDLFVRGADYRLWHRWYEGGWSDWEQLGGVLNSGPDVASWGPGRLDVFVRGTDQALWQLCYDQQWQPWRSLGGLILTDPSAVSPARDRIAVVGVGADLGLWIKNYG